MTELSTTDVAIVGVGFAATALAIDLVDRVPPSKTITLVGPADAVGRGVAYGAAATHHLLNVPAARMSALAGDPDHFVAWLGHRRTGYGAQDFVPRRLYGDYLCDSLDAALRRTGNRAAVRHVDAAAVGFAASDDGGYPIRLSTGDVLLAETAVLCLGAAPAGLPLPDDAVDPLARPAIVDAPWRDDWIRTVERDDTVVLIGTGLTMVDQVLSLVRSGHRGPIHALSRRGLLPASHRMPRAAPIDVDLRPSETGLAAALGEVRRATRHLDDWRGVMDGLRPVTQDLWSGLSFEARARFLRHLLPYWQVHRHRMAPKVGAEIDELRATGRLIVHAGRLEAIEAVGDGGVRLRMRPRGARHRLALDAGRIVNCTGADRCGTLAGYPLLSDFLAHGLIRPDPLGLGIEVDETSTVVGADGLPQRGLHALGGVTAGRFWEVTAVPEIRRQVAEVGAAIARRMAH